MNNENPEWKFSIHCLYINLEKRTDKKDYVENQLKSVGIEFERFNAIWNENGAIGCTLSHIKCLELAKENNWESVFIVEDDITFLDPYFFHTQLHTFLKKKIDFDVLLLGGNNFPPYTFVDNTCVKVSRCQTTTGYLIKRHYYNTLIENFKDGLAMLTEYPERHIHFACDKYWFKLQKKHKWLLLVPLSVIQRPGYSDIENKITNYKNLMIDIDKKDLFDTIEKKRCIANSLVFS